MTTELHLAENALALHLLLEGAESLIDVIVANENLHVIVRFQRVGLMSSGRSIRQIDGSPEDLCH